MRYLLVNHVEYHKAGSGLEPEACFIGKESPWHCLNNKDIRCLYVKKKQRLRVRTENKNKGEVKL